MKLKIQPFLVRYSVPLCIILVTLCCLFVFRSIPVSKIWNGYRVMYVEKNVSEQTVLEHLEQAGCRNVISLSGQQVPLSAQFLELSMHFTDSSYLQRRLKYFADKNDSYRLFYIPDVYESQSAKALRSLVAQTHIHAGLDEETKFPWMVPGLSILVFIALGFIASHRELFVLPSSFCVLLTFSMPFYTVGASSCLYMFAWFLANRLWGRRNDIMTVCRSFYIDFLAASAVIIMFLQSIRCGMLFLLVFLAGIAVMYILKLYQAEKDRRCSFTYQLIFSAEQLPVMYGRTVQYMVYLTVPVLAFLLFFLFSARFTPRSSLKNMVIPMPVADADMAGELPVLTDYFTWAWNTVTFPYRSLNKKYDSGHVAEGSKVVVPEFVQTDSGIKEKNSRVLVYDRDFTDRLEKEIRALEYPAVEKLLEKQGRNCQTAYVSSRSTGKTQSDSVSLILLIVALFIPLILSVLYYNTGRRKV